MSDPALPVTQVPAYRAVLLDIEGTTTPITFVHDVLFPYVLDRLEPFVKSHWGTGILTPFIRQFHEQYEADIRNGPQEAPRVHAPNDASVTTADAQASLLANIQWLMKHDRKVKALKDLQGYMWKDGYVSGELKAIVYDDVVQAFKVWHDQQIPIYIYSSGSVPAQKLLFGYSNHGDLTPYLNGYYDTNVGPKLEASSYIRIVDDIGLPPNQVMFVSDNFKEIEAATSAGLVTAISVRPGNAALPPKATDGMFRVVTEFIPLLPVN
ncbi:enolase-phosphatase E1 [Dimargaris verticillata]|uniref:Enolase-phosphatase E1 n=1 Tax=Dimargaris verticillata TaxID=2761393 RepID=A0A9W8B323_9FUNG|nr:enolase-phosphatase E1 [Dimargaris verticillata]